MSRRGFIQWILFGLALRIWLLWSGYEASFGDRREIATPANSFKRVLEGVGLEDEDISPYAGDTFHEMPLFLSLYRTLVYWLGNGLGLGLIVLDLLTALALGKAAQLYLKAGTIKVPRKSKKKGADGDKDEFEQNMEPQSPQEAFRLVTLSYLFNPYSIAACTAQTTSVIQNSLLAFTLLFMLMENGILSLATLSIAAYQGMYPAVLSVPVALSLSRSWQAGRSRSKSWATKFAVYIVLFFGFLGSLLFLSFLRQGSWDFLSATYGFLVSVPDLTPNVGLFWYFFTEMFDHFRLFFLWVFQLNLIVYLPPLAVSLRDEPVLLFHKLLMLIAVFKSYPSVADAAVYLSFMPAWRHLFPYVRHGFVVACAFICCSVLAPVMWFLWIHAGSANANFYFAITLVYSTAQIFLMTDILYAYLRRGVHLVYGMKPTIKGEKAKFALE